MKIAIGTASSYKVNAIKRALHELDFEFESIFDKADSQVSDQPIKIGETKQGSINRAKNILTKYPDCDIGIGVEFGYEPIDNKFHMVCWATIATSSNKLFSEQSSTLELPKLATEALLNNKSVEDAVLESYSKLQDTHTNQTYFNYLKKRRVIYECTENVMIRYLLDKELY